jgi:hypothetical protein
MDQRNATSPGRLGARWLRSPNLAKADSMRWHRNWFGRSTQARRHSPRRERSYRRDVEQLEGRALLSISAPTVITDFNSPPAVINYPIGSTLYTDIFVTDQADRSLREFVNGSWIDLGTPSRGVTSISNPAVTTYQTSGGGLLENVFVVAIKENRAGQPTNSDLYLDSFNGTRWKWSNLGTPASRLLLDPEFKLAVNDYQATGGILRESVFVTGVRIKSHALTNASLY